MTLSAEDAEAIATLSARIDAAIDGPAVGSQMQRTAQQRTLLREARALLVRLSREHAPPRQEIVDEAPADDV